MVSKYVYSQKLWATDGILLDLVCVPTAILCLMLPEGAKRLDTPGLEVLSGLTARPDSDSQACKWCAANT